MAHFDLPLHELENYKPEVRQEADFDDFWKQSLDETRKAARAPVFTEMPSAFDSIRIFDVSFSGYGGQMIKAWYLFPRGGSALPGVVEFIGYGGGRSLPHEFLSIPSAGMALLVMDTRGQGSGWSPGDTPDIDMVPGRAFESPGSLHDEQGMVRGENPGVMTRGIGDRHRYYYRRVFCDAVRAWETLCERPEVDASRTAAVGGSQGGGISLAVAGLVPELKLVFPDVPFLCHFNRAIRLVDSYPYGEIRDHLKTHRHSTEGVERTLSYFDGVNFGRRAQARAFFSTALMDATCPPSTVFAAYNHYQAEKQIDVWEFNGHEGGGPFQKALQIERLRSYL